MTEYNASRLVGSVHVFLFDKQTRRASLCLSSSVASETTEATYRFTLSYIKKIVRQTSWVAKAGGRYMGKSQSTWFGIMAWQAKSTQRFVYDSGTRAL